MPDRWHVPVKVSPEITAAVQHVIRNAGFHVGTMPLVDMRNGGHGHCRYCLFVYADHRPEYAARPDILALV